MPIYRYNYTDEQGGSVEVFQKMSDPELTEYEGRPCTKGVQCPNVRTEYGAGSNTKPIEMMSIALDTDAQIDEFRKRNPGTEISKDRSSGLYGVPVVKSRSEKKRVLDREGFVETN